MRRASVAVGLVLLGTAALAAGCGGRTATADGGSPPGSDGGGSDAATPPAPPPDGALAVDGPQDAPAADGPQDAPAADGADLGDGGGGADAGSGSDGSLVSAHCFRVSDLPLVPFAALVQLPPPLDATGALLPSADSFPGRQFATTVQERLTQPLPPVPGVVLEGYYFLWANRCFDIDALDATAACPGLVPKGNLYRVVAPAGHPARAHLPASGAGIFTLPVPSQPTTQVEIRTIFSSVTKADACTRVNLAQALGYPRTTLDTIAAAAAITLKTNAELLDEYQGLATFRNIAPAAPPTSSGWFGYFDDVCVVEDNPGLVIDGVLIDWEVHDARPPARTVTTVGRLADLADAKGKALVFYTNSLRDPATRAANGLDAAALATILSRCAYFSPVVWSGATPGNPARNLAGHDRDHTPLVDLQASLDEVAAAGAGAAEYAKVLPSVSLYQGRLVPVGDAGVELDLGQYLSDASQVRARAIARGLAGLGIWRNYERTGCACDRPANQFLACLYLGQCDGAFGLDRQTTASGCNGINDDPTD